MGIEDTIRPNVPAGVQPSQAVAPPVPGQAPPIPQAASMPQSQPAPSPGQPPPTPQAAASQSMGQQALDQSQQAQTSPDNQQTDSDVDDLFSNFEKKDPKLVAQGTRQLDSSVDDLFSHFDNKSDQFDPNLAPYSRRANKPGESLWDGFMREATQPVKFLAAKMRQNLGRNPNEQAAAFRSMYGDDNVRLKDNELYFRPESGDKFRKVNQQMFGGIADFVIMNALKAPGMVANAAATAATEAGITGATGGTGSLPGAALAFGVGGAANAATDNMVMQGLDKISSQPQVDPDIDVQHQILTSAGINAAVWLAGKAVANSNLAQQAVQKFRNTFASLNPFSAASDAAAPLTADQAAAGAQAEAGHTIAGLAQVRTAFKEFRQSLFPTIAENPEGTGKAVGDAMDRIHSDLEGKVGAVRKAVLGLANEKSTVVKMDNTLSELKSILREQGITFTPDKIAPADAITPGVRPPGSPPPLPTVVKGGFVDKDVMTQRDELGLQNAFGSPTGKRTINDLIARHDELQLLNNSPKGVPHQRVFNDVQAYQKLSKFDQETNSLSPGELGAYRRLQHAAAGDRNSFASDTLSGSGLPEEKFYKSAYENYSQNIDAVGQFNATFHNEQAREKMVQSLYTSSTAQKAELLDGMKQTLGDGSLEWNALRGDLVDHAVGMHTNQGVLDAPKFIQYLNSPKSNGLLNRIMSPQERKVLTQMTIESTKIPVGDALTAPQQESITNMAQLFTKLAVNGKHALMHILPFLGQDKKAVDFLLDKGFLNTLQAAEGQAQRQKIMEAMSLGEEAIKRMQIVRVPMTLKNGTKVFVDRYAPVLTPGASKGAGSLYNMVAGDSTPTNVPSAEPQPDTTQDMAVGE